MPADVSRRAKAIVVFGGAAVCAGTWYGLAANGYIFAKTNSVIFSRIEDVPTQDVAIVLGARVYEDGTPSEILQDRLWAAKRLYDAKKVTKIIVSGDHQAKEYDEPKAMYQFLVGNGVPASRIFLDHAGLRTFDTMARAAKVFGVRRAVICTQKFHLARSVYLAKTQGIDAVGLTSDLRRYRHHSVNLAREFVARSAALLDAHVFHTEPRHLGEPISLNSDGHVTHDFP